MKKYRKLLFQNLKIEFNFINIEVKISSIWLSSGVIIAKDIQSVVAIIGLGLILTIFCKLSFLLLNKIYPIIIMIYQILK